MTTVFQRYALLSGLGITIIAVTFSFFVSAASAQSSGFSAALQRMDQIIAEMQALRAEFASLHQQVSGSTPAPQVQGVQSSSIGFTEPLEYGATNDDIAWIQRLLATDPEIYPYGVDSGFFGPKTEEAIRNLQKRFGLDPVGAIGPATRTILETFLAAYPTGAFPDDVLTKIPQVPQVQGVTTTVTPSPTPVAVTTSATTNSSNPFDSITAEIDRGEASVKVEYKSGDRKRFIVTGDSKSEIARAIASRINASFDVVNAVLEVEGEEEDDSRYDDNDAEDAIDDADEAIDDADDEIKDADDDDEEVGLSEQLLGEAEDALNDAEDAYDDEDWDKAVKYAKKAEDLANEAEDAIGEEEENDRGDSDEIEEIEVDVDEDESEVTVKYEDDDDYEFTVEEDKEDEIIEAIAEELDMSEGDVEDLIDLDFGDVDEIEVLVDEEEDEARVDVTYESGVVRRFTIDADDEGDMIEEIADIIDEDEDDVEDWTDFDYR